MKILVIGATGTIGSAVVAALAARKHDVVAASRSGEVRVDIDDAASVRALDAVVCCAGNAAFKPLAALGDEDFALSLRSKLMGQVNVTRAALGTLRERSSVTLTSGALAQQPMAGSAAVSLVNAGIEGFARASGGLPAAEVARAYVAAVEGQERGQVIAAKR
jgi:nucleoside-diphosphate-sugar epimerase